MTPAEPPGEKRRRQEPDLSPLSPGIGRTLPDLVVLDDAARPIATMEAVALPGSRIPAFYAYWVSGMRLGALPDLAAIDPVLMPPEILPFMVIYAVEPDGGLRMRLIGTAVVEHTGADLTGRPIEPYGVMTTLHGRLSWCLSNRRPYVAQGQVPAAERDFIQFTALAAPFADKNGEIQRVVSVLQFIAPR